MRTTLTLADDVYQAVKILAEGSEKTLSEVTSELIRKALRPVPTPNSVDGLPVFSVSKSAEIIPGSRAHELLAEEGIE